MMLSVVIVTKNEEKNISRCIESILNCTRGIHDTEVLLVDSCSTDKTVDIAKQYPINIVQLKKDWKHSPSAGRFTGVNNVSGKYVLIIDGDMELQRGWIEKALNFMERNTKVASVIGKHYDIYCYKNNIYSKPKIVKACQGMNKLEKVDYVFGSSIFQKDLLLKVGNFQPYLRAEEEAEISYRLTKRGYELFFLPYPSIYHYCIPRHTIQETIRRFRENLWLGMGDMMYWSIKNKYYPIIWKRFKVYICFLPLVFVSISGSVFSAVLNKIILSIAFGLIPLIFILFMCIKKKSLYQGIVSVLNISIISLSLIAGLFRKINDISDYPQDVIWVKRV